MAGWHGCASGAARLGRSDEASRGPGQGGRGICQGRGLGCGARLRRATPSEIFTGHRMAFLACHGKWGQDGSAHRLLDSYGLSSVGCDGAATALCFNKPNTKEVLSDAGLPIARV